MDAAAARQRVQRRQAARRLRRAGPDPDPSSWGSWCSPTGSPIGVPEAIAAAFFDIAQNGRQTFDWLTLYGKVLRSAAGVGGSPSDYAKPPASPRPAKADNAYTGTFGNDHYGPATVTGGGNGKQTLVLGPDKQSFPLRHYTGDTFSHRTRDENAVGLSGVTFHLGADGHADTVTLENLNTTGLGTFTR